MDKHFSRPIKSPSRPSENSAARLRLGVAGCGRVFERYHLPALRRGSDFEVVSACDAAGARRDWARAALPGAECFDSMAALLEQGAQEALLVTAPPAAHHRLVMESLAAGQHVLVEKPMALSCRQAEEMLEASRAAGRVLAVGFNRRFRRTYARLREKLEDLPPGAIRSLRYEFVADVKQWQPEAVSSRAESDAATVLHDAASHQLDLVAWLAGSSIDRVSARERPGGDGRDSFIEFDARTESGLVAHCVAGHAGYYREILEVDLPERKLAVHPGGMVDSTGMSGSGVGMKGRLASFLQPLFTKLTGRPSLTGESFERQLASFACSIRSGKAAGVLADAAAGLRAVAAVEACIESLADGGAWKPVSSLVMRGKIAL